MISDEIRRLHELHQAGALSDAEFEQAKARVLSGAGGSANAYANAGERVNLNKDGSATGSGSRCGSAIESHFRTLRRSRSDRWLGGVCGGLAVAFGLEAWIWRLIFTVFTIITTGFGALAYLLMWIFVPEE